MTSSTRSKLCVTLATLICVSLAVMARAQSNAPAARAFEEQAAKALAAKDYPGLLSAAQRAAELRPNHPRLMTNLARAFALSGKTKEAFDTLELLARMGLVVAAKNDAALAELHDDARFAQIIAAFERNAQPTGNTAVALNLKRKGIIAEGLAYDAQSHAFFVGSVRQRKILRVSESGEVDDFAGTRDRLCSILGVHVDNARHLLWATSAAIPQMGNFDKSEEGNSAILKFDLATGRLLARYVVPKRGDERHVLGDLIVDSRGNVLATDSVTPAIYRLAADADHVESFITDSRVISPQGLCFSPDEKHLFMADYAAGVFVIDLATRTVSPMAPSADVTLLGIDGLYFDNGDLIGIQNGVEPQRIVRLTVSSDLRAVTKSIVVAANNPSLSEPTLAVIVGSSIYVNGNSGWSGFDDDGKPVPNAKNEDAQIVKAQLR